MSVAGCLLPVACCLVSQEVSESELRRHVESLSSDEMEGRCSGSPGAERAADLLVAAFRKAGLRPPSGGTSQEFEIPGPLGTRRRIVGRNVIGILDGKDGRLRREYVLVAAHYDGVGKKGDPNPTGRLPGARDDAIWNGADDNASGVAALLETARLLAESPPKRSVVFVAFGGEEFGNAGSLHFVRRLPEPLAAEALTAMVNLHMLGRNPGRPTEVLGTDSGEGWDAVVDSAARGMELRRSGEPPRYGDQASFAAARVPAVMLFAGFHDDYHAPGDEAGKLSWEALAARTRFAVRLAAALADLPGRIRWKEPSWSGRLGILGNDVTDAEAERLGLPPGRGGVRVSEVSAGGPAERAGLRVDDVIVEFAGRPLSRDGAKAELLRAVRAIRPGAEAAAAVLRGRDRLELRFVWRTGD
ncbi:MAG: M20/M25/M40 family metallo-hydrolase [Planctomycetes bacterium]|nr:M20/M25/M40 family metallo-hydrolase [Planctomycetota bacterium]